MSKREKRLRKFIREKKEADEPVKASDLIGFLCDKFPDYSKQEHLHFLSNEFAGKESKEEDDEISTTCSNCDKPAEGEKEVDELFGFRKMSDGKTRVQSWCKECRNS